MKLQATVLAGLLAASFALPALAQDQPQQAPPSQFQPHRDRMMRMFENLNLSDQQKQQIKTLMDNYRQAHPRGSTPDPDARKQLRDQIDAVLTPAQRTQLKANEEQFRARYQQRNDTMNVPPAPTATPN